MSAEWFFKLKEYDSLRKMGIGHLKAIQEQEERLSALNVRRQNERDTLDQLKHELVTVQQVYFESETKLKSCEEQASRLQDIGGAVDKIENYLQEASQLENFLFAHLERIDGIHKELEDKKIFLHGFEKTFIEIEGEVRTEIEKLKQENMQFSIRMKLIEEELPPDFRETLARTLKKNLAVGPFSRIENSSCYFCRYKISRTEESEIDMQKQLKTCPQCSRIFLPFGS